MHGLTNVGNFINASIFDNQVKSDHRSIFFNLRAHLSISLLSYAVATQVQFHFQSAKFFSRAFFGAGPWPIQVAGNFFLLRCNSHKKNFLFTFLFINFLPYSFNMWVVPLFSKLECFAWKCHPRRDVLIESRAMATCRRGNLEKVTVQCQVQLESKPRRCGDTSWN